MECTRDRLADLIGRDIAEVTRAVQEVSSSVVVDPFAGSGNTLYWISRHVSAGRGVGFELDDAVYEVSRRNLSIVGLDVALIHETHEVGLTTLSVPEDQLLIVFVAPPWGDALSKVSGWICAGQPPVARIVDLIVGTFPRRKILLAVQVYETVVPDSLTDLTSRCDWSTLRSYDIDAPGKNHGLLLGSVGWTATLAA